MRFLIVAPGPDFSVHDCYVGWSEALAAAGHGVIRYNLNDQIVFYDSAFLKYAPDGDGFIFKKALEADEGIGLAVDGIYSSLYRYDPDVLFIISGFMIPNELLDLARFRGTKVVVLHTECPYEDERQTAQAQHADLNLINDPISLPVFPDNTLYIPHAYRPSLHKPGPSILNYRADLTFNGTGFESRVRFFEAMGIEDLDVLLTGNWKGLSPSSPLRKFVGHDENECLPNPQTVIQYRSGLVGLNYYRREGDTTQDARGWAMGPREVEMAATGLFFLRDPRPEGDELLPMLPTFGSPAEANELVRWWLAHPEARDKAAAQAREAIAPRTFDRNVQLLTEALA